MLALLTASLLPAFLPSAVAPPVPFVRPQYWQVLPEVGWVHVDAAGNPWYRTRDGNIAASYDKAVKTVAPDQKMLLGDRAGRIWVTDLYKQGPARYFDGKKWHATKIEAQQAFGDSAGRVYLRDDREVHVLTEGKWSSQVVFPKSSYATAHFLEDAKGRVWFWAPAVPKTHWGEAAGTEGAWSFDGKRWTQHTTRTGFPGNDLQWLMALRDGRLLVLPTGGPYRIDLEKSRFWGPPAKEERFLEGYTTTRLGHSAQDLDGNQYFVGADLAKKGERATTRYNVVAVSPAGRVTVLTAEQAARLRQYPHGLYENNHRMLGWPGDEPAPPPVPVGEAICRDKEGRVYFRGSNSGVGVLWPAKERPGDVLRLRPDPKREEKRPFRIFQGPGNALWAERPGYSPLLRRTAKGWEETAVRLLPHPAWGARPMAPWMHWSQFATERFIPGAGGSLLAVVVRDVYQDAQGQAGKGKAAPFGTAWEIVQVGRDLAAKRGKELWLEGWLLRGDRATGPMPLEQLLAKERFALAARFRSQTWAGSTFDLHVDEGRRVWAAGAGKVLVAEEGGVCEWTIPPYDEGSWPLVPVSLGAMPDGRVLCCSPRKGGYHLHALSLKAGKVTAEKLPEPTWLRTEFHRIPSLLLTRDKQLWLWPHGEHGRRFTGKGWEAHPGLGRPTYEEADGTVWCLRSDPRDAKLPGYWLLRGKDVLRGPEGLGGGEMVPTADGELLCVSNYWLTTLGPAADPLKRPVVRRQILSQHMGEVPAFRDARGDLLFWGGWVVPK